MRKDEGERAGVLSDVVTRLAEIRAENHQGDVSYRDIEWLCDVAEGANYVCYAADTQPTLALDRLRQRLAAREAPEPAA